MSTRCSIAAMLGAAALLVLVPAAIPAIGAQPQTQLAQLSIPEDIEKQAFETLMDSLEQTDLPPAEIPDAGDPAAIVARPTPDNSFHNPTVADIQTYLKALNCYTGNIDGQWGAMSRRALRGAIGEAKASAGPTQENLARLRAIKDQNVCADLATAKAVPNAQNVKRRSKKSCLTFGECMARCNSGELGRNSGTGCSYICDVEIPLCPR